MSDFSALNEISQVIIGAIETVVSLATLHAGVSVVIVFIAVCVMQATTQGAGLGSRRARLLSAQRVTIGCLASRSPSTAPTLHRPDPPWLSNVPVLFAIIMLLISIGLLHRIQSEPRDDLSRDTGAGTPKAGRPAATKAKQRQGFRTDAISLLGC